MTVEVQDQDESNPDVLTGILDLPSKVNLKGKGVVPITLFGSEEINAKAIDLLSLGFGLTPDQTVGIARKGKKDKLLVNFADVNEDGFDDILVKVSRQEISSIIPRGTLDISAFGQFKDGTEVTFGLAPEDTVVFF